MSYLPYLPHLPYSSLFTIYTIFLLTFFLNSMDAIVDPKHRFDDYDISSSSSSDQDYDVLRANVKKFDLEEPEGTLKLLAELRRAHTKNVKLQTYIGDLLDIWLFRNAAHEQFRPTTTKKPKNSISSTKSHSSKNSNRKEQKLSHQSSLSKKIERTKVGNFTTKTKTQSTSETNSTDGATGSIGYTGDKSPLPLEQQNNVSLSEVLRMVTTIKHQASVVLKNACALEQQILLANDTGQSSNFDLTKQILSNLAPIIAKKSSSSVKSKSPPITQSLLLSSRLVDDSAKRLLLTNKKPYPLSWTG